MRNNEVYRLPTKFGCAVISALGGIVTIVVAIRYAISVARLTPEIPYSYILLFRLAEALVWMPLGLLGAVMLLTLGSRLEFDKIGFRIVRPLLPPFPRRSRLFTWKEVSKIRISRDSQGRQVPRLIWTSEGRRFCISDYYAGAHTLMSFINDAVSSDIIEER